MKNLLALMILPAVLLSGAAKETFMIVGTYTDGKSEGIYVYSFNSETGTAKEVSRIKSSNPSFIAISPNKKFVYAVNENGNNNNGGEISAYSFNNKTGQLTFINKQFTKGDHPCYTEIDKTGKWAVVANYSSGNLSVFPVHADGSIGEASSTIQHYGSGGDKERQDKPHVHSTMLSPDNKWLYVPDLGIDKIMIYAFDASTGKLTPAAIPYAQTKPGAGPRHVSFHPNGKFVYLVTELTGEVIGYQYKNGVMKEIQTISSIEKGKKGFAGSADIHVSPDGKFLYASNRGDFNDIAIYKINAATGQLTVAGFQSTLGKAPRNFNFDPSGNFLLAANQNTDEIVVFKRNKKTGLLTDTGNRVANGKPVCIKWITK